jgi:hypothetical protein
VSKRRIQKLIAAATRLMGEDEQVELTTMAKLGSVAKSTAIAFGGIGGLIGGVAAGMLNGGAGLAGYAGEVYIVLTDRQVLFFEGLRSTGGVGKHLASIPRELVACSEPASSAVGLKVGFEVQGLDRPLKLTFPLLPPALRGQGRELARALAKPAT